MEDELYCYIIGGGDPSGTWYKGRGTDGRYPVELPFVRGVFNPHRIEGTPICLLIHESLGSDPLRALMMDHEVVTAMALAAIQDHGTSNKILSHYREVGERVVKDRMTRIPETKTPGESPGAEPSSEQ